MEPRTLEAACLGKLPTHGDFIRHRASTPTMRAFDKWVRKGLHRMRQRHDATWEAAYDVGPTTRFLYLGRGRQAPNALLGVLRPSRDRNERTYPFAVTCEVPKSSLRARHLARLPVQADSFYSAAEDVVNEAVDGALSHREVAGRVQQIKPAISVPPSNSAPYDRYLEQHTMASFLEALFGHFEDARKYRLFKNLLDILRPQRNRSHPRLNYGLQFPLGDAVDGQSPVAAFWLDVTRRLLQHPDVELSFFWTPDTPESGSTFLLLFMGPPRASALFHRLVSDDSTEEIAQLEDMGRETNAQAALSLPDTYGSLLESEELRLQEFLERL